MKRVPGGSYIGIDELINWARMKAKPTKSRSLSIVKGKVKAVQFQLKQDRIPTVKEEPPTSSVPPGYSIDKTKARPRHRVRSAQGGPLSGAHSVMGR